MENTERALRSTLELAHPTKRVIHHHGKMMTLEAPSPEADLWLPPIVKTVSTEGTGIPELAEAIAKHESHLRQSGDWESRDRARLRSELEAVLQEELMSRYLNGSHQEAYEQSLEKVIRRDMSPYEAVRSLLNGR